jgi:two-component system, NtrC family, sensor kinase
MAAKLAVELHSGCSQPSAAQRSGTISPRDVPPRPMNKDFQTRTSAILLAVLTLAAAVFAWINFQKEREFETPYDGVWWVERHDGVTARRVDPNGPGAKAGIKEGDVLVAINDHPIKASKDVSKSTYRIGIWNKANYSLTRDNVPLPQVPLILIPRDNSENAGLRLIALIYLGIGLYVLFRRWTAPRSMHFYVFCLVSFIWYSFHFTGKLNEFDWIILWSNIAAELLQPALFLHFVLTFPETKNVVRKHRWLSLAVYVPGALLLAIRIWPCSTRPYCSLWLPVFCGTRIVTPPLPFSGSR